MEFDAPKIVEVEPKTLVVLARRFDISTRGEIPKLWQDYFDQGIEAENMVPGAMWGVSFEFSDNGFKYGCGVEVTKPAGMSNGCCVVRMVGGTYAVLSQKIAVSQFPAMFDFVYNDWMPKSGYEPAEGAAAERYPHNAAETPDAMTCEVWAPVKRKG